VISAPLVQIASNLLTDPSALESSISALERDVSALESAVKALEISSACWEPWVWVFSALVVVGVMMELWVIRHDWREEWETFAIWHFMSATRSPSRPSRLKLWVEVLSVVFIAIGVAGELGIGVKISLINGAIRGKAGELRTKNTELRDKSNQLVALINRQVEKERTARVELENSLLPRRLSVEQKKAICHALGPQNALNVVVEFPTADMQEAYAYAEDFAAAINACVKNLRNWTMGVLPVFGAGPTEPVKRGLWLKCDGGTKRLASLLERAFKAAKIPLDGIGSGTAKQGAVTILVGFKPEPSSEPSKMAKTP